MKRTIGVAAVALAGLLLGGCGGVGTEAVGEGPDGSVPVEGPNPNQPLPDTSDPLFTDDPAFSPDAPSNDSADDSATGPSENDTTPAGDNTGAPEPEPEPEPGPEPEPFPGNVSNGRVLYRLNCQECHGIDAVGGTAAGIRGASVAQITAYINGRNRHPQFGGFSGFTADDVQDIAAYLNSF